MEQARNTTAALLYKEPKTEPGTGPRTRQATSDHNTYTRTVCVCVCVFVDAYRLPCVVLLCWNPRRLTNQLAVTELSMKRWGSDEIQPSVSWRGCELPLCLTITHRCSNPWSRAWRQFTWVGEGLLTVSRHCWVDSIGEAISLVGFVKFYAEIWHDHICDWFEFLNWCSVVEFVWFVFQNKFQINDRCGFSKVYSLTSLPLSAWPWLRIQLGLNVFKLLLGAHTIVNQ